MREIIDAISNSLKDRKTLNLIYTVTLCTGLLIILLTVKEMNDKQMYVTDSEGNVTGIIQSDRSKSEEFDFNLIIKDKDGTESKKVSINKKAKQNNQKTSEESDDDEAVLRDAEIDRIINAAESTESRKVMLPDELSDGSKLSWKTVNDDNTVIVIASIYVFIILAIVWDKTRKPNDEIASTRREIIRGLPRFVNQLVLMMNAGVVLSDAIIQILRSYQMIPVSRRNRFELEFISISNQYQNQNMSAAMLINELAIETNSKELLRISTILVENERRGSNVVDNLSRESEYLWNNRKIIAKERGKIIDTKMAYPLGILLLLLIVITMAPALINL